MHGAAEHLARRALLDHAPAVHDDDAVADLLDDAEVVRDEDDGDAGLALEAHQPAEHLGLDGGVQGRGRLVGDDQLGLVDERKRDHDALPHASGELVRVLPRPRLRAFDADAPQQFDGPLARRRAARVVVEAVRLGQLGADRPVGVEGVEGVLEDHRDAPAADAAQRLLVRAHQLPAVEADASRDAGVRAVQAENGQAGGALSRAGLADEPHDLAGPHRPGGVPDGGRPPEVDAESGDVEQRRGGRCRVMLCHGALLVRPGSGRGGCG